MAGGLGPVIGRRTWWGSTGWIAETKPIGYALALKPWS
jgi:hypothetical protein